MVELYKNMTPDFFFQDDRGELIQLVHQGYDQINILKSNEGVFRGGHYHKLSKEIFYVISGEVEVTFEKDNDIQKKIFYAKDMFQIEPFVIHSMKFLKECVMVAMYDKCVIKNDGEKDIYER